MRIALLLAPVLLAAGCTGMPSVPGPGDPAVDDPCAPAPLQGFALEVEVRWADTGRPVPGACVMPGRCAPEGGSTVCRSYPHKADGEGRAVLMLPAGEWNIGASLYDPRPDMTCETSGPRVTVAIPANGSLALTIEQANHGCAVA